LPGVADELKAAYLLTGSDRPKIDRALRRLRDRFGDDSVERLSADQTSGEDAVAACNAMGLFATGRLVLVEGVERWKAPDAQAVAEYLAAPAPDTVLALVGAEIRKDSPLAKACAKAGDVLVYEVSKRELPKWVAEQFARHGVRIAPDACRALVELAGDNPYELAGEIDKLALWAGTDEIGEDEIEVLVAARADAPPWALTDAWGRREVAGVLSACESILERSTRSGEIPMLVGSMVAHVRRVQTARRLDEQGVSPRDAMSELKARHPYVAQKAFEQSRNFSADELREAIVKLSDLDLAVKGGSRLPAELELERTLVSITRPAEKA
jgi:DNA polymerase III subunit delta